jgi:hypothetical protein
MAINVRSASNIDRRIDASVPVALCPQPAHAPQQNSMTVCACGISTDNEAIGLPADEA